MKLSLRDLAIALVTAGIFLLAPAQAQEPAGAAQPSASQSSAPAAAQPSASPSPAPAASQPSASPSPAPAPGASSSPASKPTGGGASLTDPDELRKAVQNPVSDVIMLPIESVTYFGVGDRKSTAPLLKVQPVVPQDLGDWRLIHRLILPVGYLPYEGIFTPTDIPAPRGGDLGLGDTTYTCFATPAKAGDVIWGVGPAITMPTASHDTLGLGKWNAGPSMVLMTTKGDVVVGALLQQQWSVAGQKARPDVSTALIQPFISYNLPDGWYLASSPVVTANWDGDPGQKWMVPVGGGVGRVFNLGTQPVNMSSELYYYPIRTMGAQSWELRFTFTLLFPVNHQAPH